MRNVNQDLGLPSRHKYPKKGRWLGWVLPGLLGALILASSAEAAQLKAWRFDTNQNRLFFTTDGGVQPKAQLAFNPTRLVIDLPKTTLGRSPVSQAVGGAIKALRVGQLNSDTARIVIELADGYTIDPQQVLFQGISPNQWTVQLPTPQRLNQASRPSQLSAANQTRLEDIEVKAEGLVIRTSGQLPQIDVKRSRDRSWTTVDIPGATLSPQLTSRTLDINRNGVSSLQVTQLQTSPPVARLTLIMAPTSPDWQAGTAPGGVALWPQGGLAPSIGAESSLATIESVEIAGNGTQLLVRANGPLSYTTGWDRSTAAYRIAIANAQLADSLSGRQQQDSPGVRWVEAQQQDAQTVVLLVQPAAGAQIQGVRQLSDRDLFVQVTPPSVATVPRYNPPAAVAPPPLPTRLPLPARTNLPSTTPRRANDRVVVVVDPGHGGGDAGAIGIGGLREKDIVLDISRQVAAILEQQGLQAVLSRQDDREIDLEPRVQLADRVNATLFVSIHANAIDMTRPDVNGIETYYYDSGYDMARTIHNSVLQATGAPDRGVRSARFYVLRKTSMPAVLVEVGFVTGAEDAPKLADPAYRTRLAQAIARGVMQYVQRMR
ncbi:N-acetylmuramoyl-L-alanine amidase [Kamptonema formosum]|uniref:N-acetylmuramoyl-L-alanine amidase n=1 Tax=Kamptonema formosum TaxID=331992 RepID=UPI0003489E9E|nr:N-acetylmuramoyl-L-alanine amidase [Oscillatoria sp. PCC 10802]